jgi:hypothetical protein
MNIKRGLLIIIIFFTGMCLVSCKSQKETVIAEMKQISSKIERLDDVIFDNIKLTQKLKMHESRLRAVKINPKIYRIPLLIEGRSIYTSADELEIDEMSYSLAFEDLLEMHHPGKGKFKSDDPSVWKEIIIKHSKGALEHLSDVELPAIQKRIDEIEKENIVIGSKKRKLLEEYKTLQGKVVMLPEYHAALNIAAGRSIPGC